MPNEQTLNDKASMEIRAEMARQRKTGKQLAEVLGCSQQSASRRLNGETTFSIGEFISAALWLGFSPSALLDQATSAAPAQELKAAS